MEPEDKEAENWRRFRRTVIVAVIIVALIEALAAAALYWSLSSSAS
jgi:hypothetical protein